MSPFIVPVSAAPIPNLPLFKMFIATLKPSPGSVSMKKKVWTTGLLCYMRREGGWSVRGYDKWGQRARIQWCLFLMQSESIIKMETTYTSITTILFSSKEVALELEKGRRWENGGRCDMQSRSNDVCLVYWEAHATLLLRKRVHLQPKMQNKSLKTFILIFWWALNIISCLNCLLQLFHIAVKHTPNK